MDQQVYDLKIIGVNIFDDHLLRSGQYDEGTTVGHQVIYAGETNGVEKQPMAAEGDRFERAGSCMSFWSEPRASLEPRGGKKTIMKQLGKIRG